MFRKRSIEEMSVEELEKALLIKRRESRLERFQRLSRRGHSVNEALMGVESQPVKPAAAAPLPPPTPGDSPPPASARSDLRPPLRQSQAVSKEKSRSKKMMDMALLSLEIISLVGLVAVLVASYFNLKELNNEVSIAQQSVVRSQVAPTPTTPPPIALARLPGGHSSPTAPGGAVPDVPQHLQQWVQPKSASNLGPIEIAPGSSGPTRIVIPRIKVDAPIVQGVGWEDLKKGVGQLPGSANPGERGNLYLAAHNDIYGEIFRYLEDLEVGDEYFIYSGEAKFRYVVKEKRVIQPTEIGVMLPTTEPVATLQTCYPYLVDTHRLVVIGELAE
jgi:sortase A